ncbi:MAG: hypothetical protein NTY41_06870 [Proteobacteria bacterium]|nr:hypothetical protein [Pseudomonadota bacterium]
MTLSLWKFATLSLLLAATGGAQALGLGNVSGQPILGQPLLIEIPLLGTDEGIPELECFRIRPPTAEIESAFVLRNAQLQIQGERNHAKLILASASAVREPVIEFGLAVGCGFALSKDYLLLTAEPSKTALPSQQIKLPGLVPEESPGKLTDIPKPAKPVLPVPLTAKRLPIEGEATLTDLARQRYPLQPKAREKFIRMMTQANPDLIQADGLIPAGSELQVPPGLPVRRQGAYRPQSKLAAATDQPVTQPAPSISPQTANAKKPPATSAKPHHDLLVLGAPGQRNAAELLAEAERLTTILIEQTTTQNAAAEKITQLEDTLNALKKNINGLENRIATIEAERQAEKLAPKPVSLDFVELLLAVMAGGAIGGLTLHFYNRIQSRREHEFNKSRGESADSEGQRPSMASATPLKAQQSDGLPWQKGYEPKRKTTSWEAGGTSPEMGEEHKLQPLPEGTTKSAQQPATPQNDFDFVTKP